MRLSVVVPFRNAERNIVRWLGSLVAQEPFDGKYEIVAVDDRSSDQSTFLARRFAGVRVLTAQTPGPYAARNVGIAASNADVVAFTDGDCEAAPDWLRRIVEAFERTETVVVVGPRLPGRDSFALSLVAAYERAKDEFVFGGKRNDLYYASANNMAVRRRVLDELGSFEERRRGADTLYVRRVAELFSPAAVEYAPQLRVRHLEIDGLATYYRKLLAYGRSMRRLGGRGPRTLRTSERLAIWHDAVRREGLSSLRAAALLLALTGGAACWSLGSATGIVLPDQDA